MSSVRTHRVSGRVRLAAIVLLLGVAAFALFYVGSLIYYVWVDSPSEVNIAGATIAEAEKAIGSPALSYSGSDPRWNIVFATGRGSGFRAQYVFAREENGRIRDFVFEYK